MPGFEVYRDAMGFWHARRVDGRVEGIFRDGRTALRFARGEARGRGAVIMLRV